ncbi:MAG: putative toxin-antitoxin system toxin component, PIN family [Armatimonadetes bacterium]|nr:putative toxin-antitoxin system toxin component, PIN family [Armatimonadota bacterium]
MTETGNPKPLVIYNTGVVLQATLTPQSVAEKTLSMAEFGMVQAVMSNRLRSEYEDVLRRLALLPKYQKFLDEEIVSAQLECVDKIIRLVPNAPEQIEYPRDPDDAPTINLAICYEVDFVLARDKDLLALDTDPVLRKRSPKLRVVDPVTFLQIILPGGEPSA